MRPFLNFHDAARPVAARMSSFHIDPRHGHVHAPSWHGRPQIKHVWPKLVNSYLKSETVRSIGRLGFYSGSQNGEDVALHTQFFDDNEPATFVEMGALDGLKYSNTLAFERALNWRGVLIEANPAMCELLFYTTAHNRTRSQPLCTGVSKNYSRLQMEKGAFLSTYGEVNEMDSLHLKFHQRIGRYQQDFVPSAPLGQLLRMAGLASIDLFSLDVEGSELKVLNTHDWSLPVRVWCIEVNHERLPAIDELLTSKGYRHTPWQATGNYSLAGSELWVWPGQWTPAKYKWKQYR